MWLLVVFVLGLALSRGERGLKFANRQRLRFESRFNKTCMKYPFVNKWINQLENTGDKYVVFVYHEEGLRNGGLGDRIGGLISAMTISLRLNRTLLIQSANDFGTLFRPYHPTDIALPGPQQRYTWSNWTNWSRYNVSYSNNDNTELDLWDCINCVTWKNRKCGMDDGDVGHPIVKLRANRAFLCKWMKHPELQAHKELLPLGIGPKTNLFEAAGCMMRLAMWPTEKLWSYVTEEIDKLDIFKDEHDYGIQIGMHFRCGDLSYKKPGAYDRSCEHDVGGKDPHSESDYMRYGTPDALGRCAREILSNYTNGLSMSDKELSYRVSKLSLADGTVPFVFPPPDTPRAKRRLMVLANETFPESDDWGSADGDGSVGQGESANGNNPTNSTTTTTTTQFLKDPRRKRVPIVYIASDNPASANQMNQTAAWPLTYISPKGCHVSSRNCVQTCYFCWAALWNGSGVLTLESLESRLLTDFDPFPPASLDSLIPPPLGRDGQLCRLQPTHDGLLAVARHQRYHRAPERRWWLTHQRFQQVCSCVRSQGRFAA